MKTKNIVSAITLSGSLTIAHYLVVLKPLLKLRKKNNLFLFLADLHATTTGHQPIKLKFLTRETASYLFACGFSPGEIFLQSQIAGLGKLCFLLGAYSSIGNLERMTQFKAKSEEKSAQPFSLLNYPLLMASDIVLYDADVLVGNDQKQHLELTRNLAEKINHTLNYHLFHLPNLIAPPFYQYRIRDLQKPQEKMSKSSLRKQSVIFLHDKPEIIREKIIKSQTDSENKISFDFKNKPGVSNLILLYALIHDLSILEATKLLKKKSANYLILKQTVGQSIIDLLIPLQKSAKNYQKNFSQVEKFLQLGRKKAQDQVDKKFIAINHHFGFVS